VGRGRERHLAAAAHQVARACGRHDLDRPPLPSDALLPLGLLEVQEEPLIERASLRVGAAPDGHDCAANVRRVLTEAQRCGRHRVRVEGGCVGERIPDREAEVDAEREETREAAVPVRREPTVGVLQQWRNDPCPWMLLQALQ
jgi:hypothetical protein